MSANIMMQRAPTELHTILDEPAMTAPPGMHHNFVNPTNMQTKAHSITIFCLSLSVLAVGMRMWTKTRVVRQVVLEDWVCCLALATFAVHCAVLFLLYREHSSGVHQWNIRLKNLRYYLYHVRIIDAVYCIEIFLIKAAILLQYVRVFVPLKNRNLMFWACHALIWLNFIVYSICFFLVLFACKPVKKYWNPWIEGSCIEIGKLNNFTTAFNAASDLLILILPQPLIWSLQITVRKKIALSAVFLIGICACVSTTIRIYYSVKISQSKDITYYYSILNLWALIEVASGILAACSPFSTKFFRSLKDSNLWSGLRNSFHFITQSKTKSKPFGTRNDVKKTARVRDGLSSFNALFKKYNILSDGIELTTITSMEGRKEGRSSQGNHWTETSQNLETMRTIHITTTGETGPAAPTNAKPL